MGLGNKVNKFNFGDNDLADEGNRADGDSRDEGDGVNSVSCSICLETVIKDGDRAWANLQCGHQFHLDCIGSAFNAKGLMQCPNCRKVEKGQWLYANGCRPIPEFNVEDWVREEDIYDVGGHSETSFGVQWCPFGSSPLLPSFEDIEFPPGTYHDLLAHQGYFTEAAPAATAGHPCPYVTYIAPVHSSSSSTTGPTGVSDSSSFSGYWNTGSSVSSEVPTPYGFPVDPRYTSWDYYNPPLPSPQHFSASSAHVSSSTQPSPPPAAAPRTSRANGADVNRPRPPHFTRPFHGHSSSGRSSSSLASILRSPPFPGSNARTRDRTQALQAYYQQASAQSHQPESRPIYLPTPRRPSRGTASGMGSSSSSSDQAGGSGFIRFNIWERDPYMQSQQAYSVSQMDREPSIWTPEGSANFHQRHGGRGSS